MSLGLVCYDDSDESDNDTVEETEDTINNQLIQKSTNMTAQQKVATGSTEKQNITSDDHNSEQEFESNDTISDKSANLHLPQSKLINLNSDIDIKCLTSSNKRNGPVKIAIPSLNEIADDSEPPSKKKIKPSLKGSGLFALLPNPKSSLVPQSVVNRNRRTPNKKDTPKPTLSKNIKPVPKPPVTNKPILTTYEDSGDEDETSGNVDFFSLDNKDDVTHVPVDIDIKLPETNQPSEPTEIRPPNEALSFNPGFQPSSWAASSSSQPSRSTSYEPVSEYPTQEFMSVNKNDLELDQQAMQQLCGRRDRLKMQDVSIIDVSGDAIMPDSREWLTKQLTEEQSHRPSHKKKEGPTSQQKRKHQITYLAYQAKENELELKNQWANNRVSRKQTQAKYGF